MKVSQRCVCHLCSMRTGTLQPSNGANHALCTQIYDAVVTPSNMSLTAVASAFSSAAPASPANPSFSRSPSSSSPAWNSTSVMIGALRLYERYVVCCTSSSSNAAPETQTATQASTTSIQGRSTIWAPTAASAAFRRLHNFFRHRTCLAYTFTDIFASSSLQEGHRSIADLLCLENLLLGHLWGAPDRGTHQKRTRFTSRR